MGYDEKFIDMATRTLLVSLTRQPAEAFARKDKSGALELPHPPQQP